MVRKNIRNQYLHSFCLHSRCTGNVPPALFHFNPVLSLQYCTVHIGVPTTHKVSTLMFGFFSCWNIHILFQVLHHNHNAKSNQ